MSSTLPVPKNTPDIVLAIGNQVSCNIQGFIMVFSTASFPLYFCGLTTYFFLAIKFGISEEKLKKYFEPYVHGFSIAWGLTSAIFSAVHHRGFATTGGMCWIGPEPRYCDKDDTIDCIRGADYNLVRWIFLAWPIIIVFGIVTANMLIIFFSLMCENKNPNISLGAPAQEEMKTDTEDIRERTSMNRRPSSVLELYAATKKNRKSSQANRDRREGMIQAILYILAFMFSYIFSILYHAMDGKNKTPHFAVSMLAKIFHPIQGLNNFFIYIRPTILNIRRRHKSYSWKQAFVAALKSRGEMQRKTLRRSLPKSKKYSQLRVEKKSNEADAENPERVSFPVSQEVVESSATGNVTIDEGQE